MSSASAPATPSPSAALFARQRYMIVPGIIAPQEAQALGEHIEKMRTDGLMSMDDPFVHNTPAIYGDVMFERLLGQLGPRLQYYTGLLLYPTYSFARIYKNGDELTAHRDREACEVSISLNLGQQPDEPWPLWLQDTEGRDIPAVLQPGDALIYRGIELTHWRTPYTGEKLAQVFLHYVDRNGPHADQKFDGRQGLGLPGVKRP